MAKRQNYSNGNARVRDRRQKPEERETGRNRPSRNEGESDGGKALNVGSLSFGQSPAPLRQQAAPDWTSTRLNVSSVLAVSRKCVRAKIKAQQRQKRAMGKGDCRERERGTRRMLALNKLRRFWEQGAGAVC